MKVFIVGANGQIGKHLTSMLKESSEHQVRAMVRSEEQAETLKRSGIETALANLEGTVHEIAEAAKGCDAIVFTAGSGGKTGADKTLLVDLDGAAKTIEAAEKAGIQRFIMISVLQAHHRENWNEAIKPYFVAKHYADKILERSSLTYTIIRPGGLLNEPGTGKIKAAENLERGTIPREDVAATVAAALSEERTFRRSFDLLSGETAIAEAIKAI
ncbi:SDR family oxidoreductase [Bacillus glycinifermentans]|uniref:SDR family oxidoreductase n=1 Tax=Bacillus glycinifermentans TaxID=1664069 RepID=A0A0T6BPS7_9BACI|nr:SDR family oxidoreductase [Bacillus glycinifermentans]ATH94604.1 NAD(P)-dependent oxidoreductase [Bacillus glycinifermentans]KRT93657.1 sugar epimerase [Bacillus glycinifermentans]MEC0486115.1 SDR family oxidoreductase [Bacillus glycinifermentans]MEC0494027.1 SDR family oxidoreductase [Bacillus glycinifermentans]MEC0542192.1 SDR family oxidoreductase [Bacillus glycinifermentans]